MKPAATAAGFCIPAAPLAGTNPQEATIAAVGRMNPMLRILARVTFALLLLPLLLIRPGQAVAHDRLTDSVPKAGARTEPIDAVSLVFNNAVLGTGAAVQVQGPSGTVQQDTPAVSGARVTQKLRTPLANGSYQVIWRVVSSDGHPISGKFDFTVEGANDAAGSAASSRSSDASSEATIPATSPKPTPPAQEVPTSETDNNAPLIIAAAALALLLIAGGAFLTKGRLKDDDADTHGVAEESDESRSPAEPHDSAPTTTDSRSAEADSGTDADSTSSPATRQDDEPGPRDQHSDEHPRD